MNLWTNYDKLYPERLDCVRTKEQALHYIECMFEEFGIQENLFYTPPVHDPDQMQQGNGGIKEGEDDLFVYARDVFVRYLLVLSFDLVEKTRDADSWLALRMTLVPAFLGNNLRTQASKYAASLLFDILLELSASPRTKERMRRHMVVYKSGSSPVFMDKFIEWCVRKVKTMYRGTHGRVDSLILEKELGSLNLLSAVCDHDAESMLRQENKSGSQDFLKDSGRFVIEEQVMESDPFNRQRKTRFVFRDTPRGSPYTGLKESELERFLARKKKEYAKKY